MPTQAEWMQTAGYVYVLLKDAGDHALALRRACLALPLSDRELLGNVYYHPHEKYAFAVTMDRDCWPAVEDALSPHGPMILSDGEPPPRRREEPWVLVKAGGGLRPIGEALNFLPNSVNRLFGGPSPLAASLTGGLVGAGLGYGTGWLAEKLLPERHFEKGRLRKVLAALGGGAGMIPGAAWGAVSYRANPEKPGLRALVHGWPLRDQDMPPPPEELQAQKIGSVSEAYEALLQACGLEKSAQGFAGGFGVNPIPVDEFNQVVWQDHNTPLDVRAATTGLTESASVVRGGSGIVTPLDVGRIAIGMGSGYLSGMLVGKTLGVLAGLRPESQKSLQQVGTWAGLLSNIVPLAFGRA